MKRREWTWKIGPVAALVVGILVFYSCQENSSSAPLVPEITSISPTMGPTGTAVTISGSGFSGTPSENKVTFDGTLADVSSASESSIEASVPEGATSGAVAVVVAGQTAVGPNFTVEEIMPGISAVEPDSGKVGTEVTITGMNFSATPEENIVTFNGGVISEVQHASDTELITQVPEGAESGPILVEVDGQKTQSPTFMVIPTAGTLEVTVSTTGTDLDPDGYTLTLRSTGEQRALDPQGAAIFEEVAVGDHELEVSGVAGNCSVDGANPQAITVSGGETATAAFNVECTEIGQIAFVSDRTGDDEIWVIRSDGANQSNLTNDPASDLFHHWSPDGTKIAFSSDRTGDNEIWVAEANGDNPTKMTNITGRDTRPRWSPDGTKIAFVSYRTGDFEIYVMDADNRFSRTNLTNDPEYDDNPRWSPDGTRIAFTSDRTGDREIWVMDANGANPTNLTRDNTAGDFNPRWSPDGTKIAFRSNRTGDWEMWVMDADGANPTNLTNDPASDTDYHWSPDGTKIAFTSDRTGDREIWVMDADGSNPTNLTNNPEQDKSPRWSPDGTKIAFVSNRTGDFRTGDDEIWVMDSDGSNQINLTTNSTGEDTDPRWRPEQ